MKSAGNLLPITTANIQMCFFFLFFPFFIMIVPTSFDAQTNQFPLFNPTSSLKITKLNHLNYLFWKATMFPYLKGQKVFGYVDGTLKQSSKETTTENGTQSANPLFLIVSMPLLLVKFLHRFPTNPLLMSYGRPLLLFLHLNLELKKSRYGVNSLQPVKPLKQQVNIS
jgi:hypothetical protein